MATKKSSGSKSRSGSSGGGKSKSGGGSSSRSGGSSSGGKSRSLGSSGRSGTSSKSGSSSGKSPGSSGGSQRKGLKGTATKVVGSVKKHPITTAAIGAGVAIAAVAGVRKAMASRAASQQEDEDVESQDDESSDDEEGVSDDDDEEDPGAEASSEEDDEGDESDDDEDDDEESSSGRGGWASRLGQVLSGGGGGGARSSIGRAAKDSYKRGREAARETWENNALALAAGALVAGATLGLLLPSTKQESRLMGKWSDRFAGPAKEIGQNLLGQGKRIAGKLISEGYSATQEEAEKVGLTPNRIGKKVKRIASHVRDAVAKAVEDGE